MMVTVHIYLKSGQTIEFKCEKVTARKGVDGELTDLAWDGANLPMPRFLPLDNVAAVTF